MCDWYLIFFFFLVKRAGRHFGFFKRAGRHEKGAGRRALQKKPRQNTDNDNPNHVYNANPNITPTIIHVDYHPMAAITLVDTISEWIFFSYASLTLWRIYGEWTYECNSPSIRNARKGRQTFVAVRKHSRSFLWCFKCYAGLTSGECMANGITNAIRHQFAMIAMWSPDIRGCS